MPTATEGDQTSSSAVDLRSRVRFAPSPTGFLHLGSARVALFNWLFARRTGAEFLLRIEDTDHERSRPEYFEVIFEVLDWLGIDWDNRGREMLQSAQRGAHLAAVHALVASGHAYGCDCTQEQVRARAEQRGGTPGYDGHCRDRGMGVGEGGVVRFRTPDSGETAWVDLIRGPIVFENSNLEDFVLQRSDGTPVFLIANAVDDHAMGITHVFRGEDLINVTPKVILLWEALGFGPLPHYAHLPLIVNEQRKKLSKRRDDVSVADYRGRGILPEAMMNFLCLLGWGPPDGIEIRPLEEVVALFDIEDVNPSPAGFDMKKLLHINGEWIRGLNSDEFVRRCLDYFGAMGVPWPEASFDLDRFSALAPELQTRVSTLAEVAPMADFCFLDEPLTDPDAWERAMADSDTAAKLLGGAIEAYTDAPWDAVVLHERTAELAERSGLKLGRAQAPIRVAVTGRRVGPPLFESIQVLGRERTLGRLAQALDRLGGAAPA